MPLNTGVVELSGAGVAIRVYYDKTVPASPTQPLVNGPRGWCLDLTNTTGQRARVTVHGVVARPVVITVAKGDPVATGPAEGRSRTAAQLAALGVRTRGDLGQIALE